MQGIDLTAGATRNFCLSVVIQIVTMEVYFIVELPELRW